ncbi:hypothetical protein [Roseateles sp.]|uniref:hypothetical protein n=1 Tax=Roseateles sp. TaxID=1971397 RepID=UPI003267F084
MKPLLLVLTFCIALPCLAQTQVRRTQVYRCGAEGRDLRDSPCPGGTAASSVDYDEPSNADSRAARARHLADAKQAAALASARRASDAEGRHTRATLIGLQPSAVPAQPASAPKVTYLKPPKTAKPRKPAAKANSDGR